MARLFSDIFLAHTGKSSDKWEQYLSVYDAELASLAESEEPVSVLEIGVQNGGSLEIWKNYLPKGSSIVGLDIDPAVASLVFEPPIEVHIVDAAKRDPVDAVLGDRLFDVVIDDGSHLGADVIASFRHLFPRVKPGGKYIIEDLHASYMAALGSSLGHPASAIEWLKTLVDAVNFQHIEDTDRGQTLDIEELESVGGRLARISFFDSMAVIDVLEGDRRTMRYRRLLAGRDDAVIRLATLAKHHSPHMGRLALSAAAAERIEESLAVQLFEARSEQLKSEEIAGRLSDEKVKIQGQLEEMREQFRREVAVLADAQVVIAELRSALADREQRIELLESAIAALTAAPPPTDKFAT